MATVVICDVCKEVIDDDDRNGSIELTMRTGHTYQNHELNVSGKWITGTITLGNVCIRDFTEIRVVIQNLLNREPGPTAVHVK